MKDKATVDTPHPEYIEYLPLWESCEHANAGEAEVHEHGETYLPKLVGELSDDYTKRVNRTPFFNAVARTIQGLCGMVFRKPPAVELPPKTQSYADDIDLAGTNLVSFVADIVDEYLESGRVGVLVDHPEQTDGDGLTVAEAEARGYRPALKKYCAEHIINWKNGRVSNRHQLTMVVLKESASVATSEFDHTTEDRYRVLDLFNGIYRQRVFRKGDNGEDEQIGSDIFPTINGNPFYFIPFRIIGGIDPKTPPLMGLVDINFHHYQVNADYHHGLHLSMPTLFVTGYRPINEPGKPSPTIYIGGTAANILPDTGANAFFAEVSSNFEGHRQALLDLKNEMAVLGARMLESQKASVEASETLARRQNGEDSYLAEISQMISRDMEWLLGIFAEWAGDSGEGAFKLNRDFVPAGMGAQELTALVGAWQSGAISQQTLFDNLQRGEIIDGSVTFEEEQARIGEAPLNLSAPDNPADGIGMEQNNEPAPQIDLSGIVALLGEIAAKETAEPVINLPAPIVNVAAPIVNIPEQPAPTINITQPDINISPPAITVNIPEQQPANVTVNNDGAKKITITRDAEGNIISGEVK